MGQCSYHTEVMFYYLQEFEVKFPFPMQAYIQDGTPSFSTSQLEGPPKQLTKHLQIMRHVACSFEMGIHKSARFIKKIDELKALETTDLFTLFKHASTELAMTFLAGRFSDGKVFFPEDNTYFVDNECVMKNICLSKWRGCDFMDLKKRFFRTYNDLQLVESEQAIFALLIITAPGNMS